MWPDQGTERWTDRWTGRWTPLLAVAAFTTTFVACQPAGEQGVREGAEDTAAAEAGAEEGAKAPGVSVSLVPKNQSGMSGTAVIREAAGDSIEVTLELSGLSAGESYPAHVHRGTCDSPGGVTAALQAVSAEADTASSRATVQDPRAGSPGGDFLIQVHLPDGAPAACGMIPTHREGPAAD